MTMQLFFLHIMKTAGTAVHQQLSLRFPAGSFLNGVHHAGVRDRDPNDYQFIRGVVNYGYLSRFAQRPMILTILRDPLERNLSAFSYFSTWTDQQISYFRERFQSEYGELRIRFSQLGRKLGLSKLIAQEPELARRFLSNIQTRALMFSEPNGDPTTNPEAWLAEAQDNLSRCDVVGLCERLDDSLRLLEHRLGWQGLTPIPRANVTKDRLRAHAVDPQTLAVLRDWNRLDEQLVAFATRRFDEQLSQLRVDAERSYSRDESRCQLPTGERFTFSQPIHGNGWHLREQMGKTVTCWSRSDQDAWLDLAVPPREQLWFRARVIRALKPSLLAGLRIFVNQEELSLTRHRDGKITVLEAPIPQSALDGPVARITLRFPEAIRPCDLRRGNTDERYLGVALESLSLTSEPPLNGWKASRLVKQVGQRLSQSFSQMWSPQT